MFPLKPFQESAINKLKDKFILAWKAGDAGMNITFKSPTGSGKTIMLAQFLRDLVADPRIIDTKKAFIWLAPKGLEMQSMDKLQKFYGGASELNLVNISDVNNGSMDNHDALFVNWELLRANNIANRRLRRDPGEQGYSFDQYLTNTHEKGIEVVVILDEEHIGTTTNAALELVNNIIKPRITIRVSATPEQTGGFMVEVPHSDVIEAGLIKEKVIFQTEEDLKSLKKKELDKDQELLELAFNKRLELVKAYKDLKIDINPLVMIQLPNDDQARRETENQTKEQIVLAYLESKGVSADKIAVWLSSKKENLETVEVANNPVEFLIFKQAAATGWDCPRAGVLVMFREIGGQTFHTQTIGRILRMPEAKYYPVQLLNRGYLFTNYERNKVLEGVRSGSEKDPTIAGILADQRSVRKDKVKIYELPTTIMSRADYNDLGDTFQTTFSETATKDFGIKDKKTVSKVLKDAGFSESNAIVPTEWVVGIELDNYDNFKKEALEEGVIFDASLSRHDVERLYNLLCFDIISKQTDDLKKFAPERSWGKLKTALNIFFINHLKQSRVITYGMIVRDLISEDSKLRPIIGKALSAYRPIRNKEVEKRQSKIKREEVIMIPQQELILPGHYVEIKPKKCSHAPCFIPPNIVENENKFIKYLEGNKKVLFWMKNGDSGSDSLAIPYYSKLEHKDRLFYPDWLIWTEKDLWIVDTKEGITASAPDTKDKAEALHTYLKAQKGLSGGIVVPDGQNGWKLSNSAKYEYGPDLVGWGDLSKLI